MLVKEGGNVFKNADKSLATKRIDRVDVETTLAWLEKITGLPHNDFKLGSTGIADTSGDLDVAVNVDDVSKEESKPLKPKKLSKKEKIVYDKYLDKKPKDLEELSKLLKMPLEHLRVYKSRIIKKGFVMNFEYN